MRLLSRLEYERSFSASWSTYFVRIPYQVLIKMNPRLDVIKAAEG
jgi:hypothetical protein